jgi:hypothetical protein
MLRNKRIDKIKSKQPEKQVAFFKVNDPDKGHHEKSDAII